MGIRDMNGRQRLLNALSGKETDRIPISPWIYNNFIFENFEYEPKSLSEFHFGNSDFDLEKTQFKRSLRITLI